MFSKDSKTRGDHRSKGSASVPSIVAGDLSVTGNFVGTGEMQIDGSVEGDIDCQTLTIGVSGTVSGHVRAETVRLHGQLMGQIHARNVFLASTSRMVGDVTHESLAIEPGAFLEGHCRRMSSDCGGASLDVSDKTRGAGLRLTDSSRSVATSQEEDVLDTVVGA